MEIIRAPWWGLSLYPAEYWGWHHAAHVGPLVIFWGKMTEAELNQRDKEWR